jgi:hypothetical protein
VQALDHGLASFVGSLCRRCGERPSSILDGYVCVMIMFFLWC